MNSIVRQLNPFGVWDGATGDGATEDWATGDGATEDWATGDGATGDGATRDGEAKDWATGTGEKKDQVGTICGSARVITRGFMICVCFTTGVSTANAESEMDPATALGRGGASAMTGAQLHAYEQ
jgi:hypothetical protein